MKSYFNTSSLTETELREQIAKLELLADQGKLTQHSAERLQELRAALATIKRAKNRVSLW